MTPSRRTFSSLVRLAYPVFFSVLLGAGTVHADDFPDITALLKSGKAADALVKVDQRLVATPRDPQLRFLRGVAQADSGKQDDAIATFTQLTQDYPELPEPYNNLAVLYAGQNQLDKARIALEMAVRTNPSYATAHENLGDIYARLAGQAYSKALQLDASNSAALNPKLALIRSLFAPGQASGNPLHTAAATVAPPSHVPAPAGAPAQAPAPTIAAPAPKAPAVPPVAPVTPVVHAPVAEPVSPSTTNAGTVSSTETTAKEDVEASVKAWAAAWSARDVKTYLGAYSKQFSPPDKQSRAAWEKQVAARIAKKARIQVTVSDLSVKVTGDHATARFHQDYHADNLKLTTRKTLDLMRTQGHWRIVQESTGG